ncbi:hypothetical protein B0H10DRAFT_1951827 [Mycena sp. CBHHK59/15]|nr:hypothetical protein B0H10DRAFT_1951827 [Mycena sp. CBHHK59/15]
MTPGQRMCIRFGGTPNRVRSLQTRGAAHESDQVRVSGAGASEKAQGRVNAGEMHLVGQLGDDRISDQVSHQFNLKSVQGNDSGVESLAGVGIDGTQVCRRVAVSGFREPPRSQCYAIVSANPSSGGQRRWFWPAAVKIYPLEGLYWRKHQGSRAGSISGSTQEALLPLPVRRVNNVDLTWKEIKLEVSESKS